MLRILLFLNLILIMQGELYCQKFVCPRKEVDCKGLCGRFIDKNNDGYCDYSIFSEEISNMLTAKNDSLASLKNIINEDKKLNTDKNVENVHNQQVNITNSNQNDSVNNSSNENIKSKKIKPEIIKDDLIAEVDNDTIISLNKGFKSDKEQVNNKTKQAYPFLIILSSLTLLYIVSVFLVSKCILRKCTQRRIWNSLLLITFLVSGLSGLLMVAMLNYNFWINSFMPILKWHVIFGIAMAIISIFHFLWHIKYYRNIIFNNKITKNCDGK